MTIYGIQCDAIDCCARCIYIAGHIFIALDSVSSLLEAGLVIVCTDTSCISAKQVCIPSGVGTEKPLYV